MPENFTDAIVTAYEQTENDLEDGEIRDELEDVSDCSLTEILSIQEDLNNDLDTELLREEAIKSIHEEKDEITEEELYRLEALKSLLVNLEESGSKSVGKLPEKKRRKRKKKAKEKPQNDKRRKVTIVKEKKDEDCSKSVIKVEVVTGENEPNNENRPSRSWYPRCEFALLSTFHVDDLKSKIKCQPKINTNPVTRCDQDATNRKVISVTQPLPVKLGKSYQPKCFPSSAAAPVSQFKKITKHSIRKIDSTLPAINKFMPAKTGKYKLVNASKCVRKETSDTLSTKSTVFKSKYSINRKQTQLPRINPKDFVIELKDDDDDDSGNEIESNFSTSSGLTMDGSESTRCQCNNETPSNFSDNTESSLPYVIDTNPDPLECTGQENSLLEGPNSTVEAFEGSTRSSTREASFEIKKASIPAQTKSNSAQTKSSNDALTDATLNRRPKTVNVTSNGKINASKSNLLKEVETDLVKIRARLLSDMGGLEDAIKKNTAEETKLHKMMEKLTSLKSMVLKFEKNIDLQKSKLMLSSKSMHLLFKGIKLRSGTCSQMKEICICAGKEVVGASYRPPDEHEDTITKKLDGIDFSKYAFLNAKT